MSPYPIYILGGFVFVFLVGSSIMDFIAGSKKENEKNKLTLYTSGIISMIAAFIVIIMFLLLGRLTSGLASSQNTTDETVEKLYKFSRSYLFNIPEDSVYLPPRRNVYIRSLYQNSPPPPPVRVNQPQT